jgi:deferrochelatase/peroxidase EfeB
MNEQRPTEVAPVELEDVQGILRFGYKHHKEACFLLLRVKDAGAARTWLAQAPVTSAVTADPPPRTALQVAFTSEGLRALDIADDIIDGFSAEFNEGMCRDADRARRLGDVGQNAPGHWQWGAGDRVPHVLVLLYAVPGRLGEWRQAIEAQCDAGFEQMACLSVSDLRDDEPFGFVDGISQPEIDWARRRPARDQDQLAYTNLSCLGEFLLGYPNEYGLYTDRPLLEPHRDSGGMLPRAENIIDKADLGRNGSYLVMRQLRQDVQGFWQFLHQQAGGDPALRQRRAEAMVGRTLRGVPLVGGTSATSAGDAAPPATDLNAFTYEADPQGIRCPLGAHIRRTNPRNADLPPGGPGIVSRLKRMLGFDARALAQDRVASTRFHRLLRRGRDYGAQLSMEQALSDTPTGSESGLYFICLNANIARQFEFVQSAWVMGTKFDGLGNEGDPLLGNRQADADGTPSDVFSMPRPDGPDERLCGLPQFVTVRGGAYFFLPGIRALRYLATSR